MDRRLGRLLPDRPRRLQRAAGAADGVPGPAGRRRRVHRDQEGRQALLRDGVPDPVRDAGHVRRAGPVPVLPVLGNDADPDVPDHRHLGRRAAHLRDAQVRPLHGVRQHPDARRRDLPRATRCTTTTGVTSFAFADLYRRSCRCPSQIAAAVGVRAVVRDQGADGAAAHVAARRARRGADRGLGDPRRRAAEDGNVRLHEAGLPAVSRRDARAARRRS